MLRAVIQNRGLWLAAGLAVGWLVHSLWSETPLDAVATDRHENFAVATGPLDEDVEAFYFLDSATGDLMASVLSTQSGKFNSFYKYNILNDLGVDPGKNPRFLIVTGVADIRRGSARIRPGRSIVYVAELTTGKVGAYAIPWARERHNAGQPFVGTFVPLDVTRMRTTAVREQ